MSLSEDYTPAAASGGSGSVADSRINVAGNYSTTLGFAGLAVADSAGSDLSYTPGASTVVVATAGLYYAQLLTSDTAGGWQLVSGGNDINPAANGAAGGASSAGGEMSTLMERFVDMSSPVGFHIQAVGTPTDGAYVGVDVFRIA